MSLPRNQLWFLAAFTAAWFTANGASEFDLIIRNGTIYDGNGGKPFTGEVAINGETIAAVGKLNDARGKQEIDAKGLAVAPGDCKGARAKSRRDGPSAAAWTGSRWLRWPRRPGPFGSSSARPSAT